MRRWVKIWVKESLTGTVRFDFTPAERGVWYDLLILAGNCRLDGIIAAGTGKPYPHKWIAGTLNIPLKLLENTLKKCKDSDRIYENSDGIQILNWSKYQSEYERQKQYRSGQKPGEKIFKKCPECDYKARTDERYCPKCAESGEYVELEKDYTGGAYGSHVRQ